MEQDINHWAANSIADLTDSVSILSDKEQTEAQLATFQVREHAGQSAWKSVWMIMMMV